MDNFLTNIKSAMTKQGENKERMFDYFSLEDGEQKTFRFITGFDYMNIINHPCGLQGFEIANSMYQTDVQSGGYKCPQCGQLVTDEHIVGVRPRGIMSRQHGFVPGLNGKRTTFVCKGHGCEICKVKDENGKTAYPAGDKLVMFGIEYIKTPGQPKLINNIQRPTIASIDPVLAEDGSYKIIQFARPVSFYATIFDTFESDGRCDTYFYDITRTGTGTNTRYTITRVAGEPTIEPYGNYSAKLQEVVQDTESMFEKMAADEYYVKHGYGNAPQGGFQPQQMTPQQQPAQPQPQQVMPQQNTVSWEEAQKQVNTHNGNNSPLASYL